jgi:hypothetical protein
MAQHDYAIANQSGAAFRADLNNALSAIASQNSGAAEPSTTFAYMRWADTTAGVMKMRNGANSAWITLYQLDGEWTSIALENGTAAAPPLYFKDSGTDTGIYSSGTDALDFATGGTQRVGIGSGGNVTVYGGNVTLNAQGDLRFADSDSSNWVALQAPTTVTSNVTWTLPATDGTNGQALKTNGSGTLSWGDAGAAVATRADVDGVHTTGTVTSGTASLTVASATGIVAGMVVAGEGITPGTTVASISGTTVTLSANAGATLSSDPVGFYDNAKALSPGSVGGQLCRAWVNFDGTGTVAIRASFNVSSITDNGTGDYTVNFTTAMPDANYVFVPSSSRESGSVGSRSLCYLDGQTKTTSAIRLVNLASGSTIAVDNAELSVAIFR